MFSKRDGEHENDPRIPTFRLDSSKSLDWFSANVYSGDLFHTPASYAQGFIPFFILVEGWEIPILSIISTMFRVYKNSQCFWDYYLTRIKYFYKFKLKTGLAKWKKDF